MSLEKKYFFRESTKVSEESNEKKKATTTEVCSVEKKNDDKMAFEEKTIKFKSFEKFLDEYTNQLETLSANKINRLSKTYFITLCILRLI